jgi:hypothetical protein
MGRATFWAISFSKTHQVTLASMDLSLSEYLIPRVRNEWRCQSLFSPQIKLFYIHNAHHNRQLAAFASNASLLWRHLSELRRE